MLQALRFNSAEIANLAANKCGISVLEQETQIYIIKKENQYFLECKGKI